MSAFEEEAIDLAEKVDCGNPDRCYWPSTDCKHHEIFKRDILEALEAAHARGRKEAFEESAVIAENHMCEWPDQCCCDDEISAKIRERIK